MWSKKLVLLSLLGLLGLIVMAAWYGFRPEAIGADQFLQRAESLYLEGRYAEAEEQAVLCLDLEPQQGSAALVAAKAADAREDWQQAVAYLQRIDQFSAELVVPGRLLEAKIEHHRLFRYSAAEAAYRKVLQQQPDHIEANGGLAALYEECGRHQEAIPLVLRIVRQGLFTDLVFALGIPGTGFPDSSALEKVRLAEPNNPSALLGLAAFSVRESKPQEALRLLDQAVRLDPEFRPARLERGPLLLQLDRFEELAQWIQRLPQSAWKHPEPWEARGVLAERQDDFPGAIRCYGEAISRSPESKSALFRLSQLLHQSGQAELAEPFDDYLGTLQELETLQVHFEPSTDYYLKLAKVLDRAGRIWEAYAWCGKACAERGASQNDLSYFEDLQRRVRGLPLVLTVADANPAKTLDLANYPLVDHLETAPPAAEPKLISDTISGPERRFRFREEAKAVHLNFTFQNGKPGPPTHHIYELTGGGIGILDFDMDGFPDAFFTQGTAWPPQSSADSPTDGIFRNLDGKRFQEVTAAAGIREADFGQGVTVGDFNADGFPDLYVANIGPNRLWINNGDGTFTDGTEAAGLNGQEWTTSCVMADLDGDSLPDIFDVNYMQGPGIFQKICKLPDGSPRMCMPFRFDVAPDRLWINQGSGEFQDRTQEMLLENRDGKGLGVLAWDALGDGSLSLFVANDVTPNNFLVPETAANGKPRLRDRGLQSGLAFDRDGKTQGCMGVALADLGQGDQLDLFVTNFRDESNTLYAQTAPGLYFDRADDFALADVSRPLVGFGTQFLDADLDGNYELFVTNGDIEDRSRQGLAYRMPAQLFTLAGNRFREIPGNGVGKYFQQKWVGRAAALWDWNRDGQSDLLVGHLDAPAALLTNTTPHAGQYLALTLVGVKSNRDAIGTTIRAKLGNRRLIRQLAGGDGYQASNQRTITIGTGQNQVLDELSVHWPKGGMQKFKNLKLPLNALLVEGGRLLALP